MWPYPIYVAGAGLLCKKALVLAGLPPWSPLQLLAVAMASAAVLMGLVEVIGRCMAPKKVEVPLAQPNVVDFRSKREQLLADHQGETNGGRGT